MTTSFLSAFTGAASAIPSIFLVMLIALVLGWSWNLYQNIGRSFSPPSYERQLSVQVDMPKAFLPYFFFAFFLRSATCTLLSCDLNDRGYRISARA